MGRYIARRLLLTIPVLLGSTFLIFALDQAVFVPGTWLDRCRGGSRQVREVGPRSSDRRSAMLDQGSPRSSVS